MFEINKLLLDYWFSTTFQLCYRTNSPFDFSIRSSFVRNLSVPANLAYERYQLARQFCTLYCSNNAKRIRRCFFLNYISIKIVSTMLSLGLFRFFKRLMTVTFLGKSKKTPAMSFWALKPVVGSLATYFLGEIYYFNCISTSEVLWYPQVFYSSFWLLCQQNVILLFEYSENILSPTIIIQ